MKKLLVSFGLVFALASIAQAKTPPEVLKPYKKYQTALKEGDKDKAVKAAKNAWEAAETYLGSISTTGDLAQNYADAVKFTNRIAAIRAYKRAIELSDLSSEEGQDIKAQRLVSLAMSLMASNKSSEMDDSLSSLKRHLTNYSMLGGTYEAEYLTLSGWRYSKKGWTSKASLRLEKAIQIFEGPKHNIPSALPHLARIYKGDMFLNDDKPIEAALEYQKVMQTLKNYADAENVTVRRAFSSWLNCRSIITEKKLMVQAENAGVCKCWPYDEMKKNSPLPISRIPPKMPKYAENSGRVIVKFDISDAGHPTNIKVIQMTENIFVKPAMESIRGWRYEPLELNENKEARKGIVNAIVFQLAGNGSFYKEKPLRNWKD